MNTTPVPPFGRRQLVRRLAMIALIGALGLAAPQLSAAEPAPPLKPLPRFLRNPQVAERYLRTRDVAELIQFERAEPVCKQLVQRSGVPIQVRREAIEALAKLHASDDVTELISWIDQLDRGATAPDGAATRAPLQDLCSILPTLSRDQLGRHGESLKSLAIQARQPETRQAALAGWTCGAARPDEVWQFAASQPDWLRELLLGLRWLPDDAPRALLDPLVRPLILQDDDKETRRAAIAALGRLGTQPRATFVALADLLQQGVETAACVQSIRQLDRAHWDESRFEPMARQLLDYFRHRPIEERTGSDAQQTIELIRTLAQPLPADVSAGLKRDLDSLIVKQVTIRALEEKMAYDQTVLVVQAGQGVQLAFENTDIMPHNLVVVDSPAAREEVGIAADQMQNEPDALQKGYLPSSNQVLHATRLLQPKQSDTITFVAPSKTGTYAYLCTYPGHWSKMYGALVVAEDAAAYLLANRPLPAVDDLLGIQKVNWQFDQLSSQLDQLEQPRSLSNGQRAFLKASCFSCHQLQKQGGRIGPDLTGIRQKYKSPAELLRQIMFPSEKLEEKYATVTVETSDGQVVRGVVVSESDQELGVVENPLASCAPRIVRKADIEELSRSQVSPMPEKLLDTLTNAQDVLDLLAYLSQASESNSDEPKR